MPNYNLVYFNGRGRGELTRLIFAAANIPFTDSRIDLATEWPARSNETPIGTLPYMDVDGVILAQSAAIARFAAKEANLAGHTNLDQVFNFIILIYYDF